MIPNGLWARSYEEDVFLARVEASLFGVVTKFGEHVGSLVDPDSMLAVNDGLRALEGGNHVMGLYNQDGLPARVHNVLPPLLPRPCVDLVRVRGGPGAEDHVMVLYYLLPLSLMGLDCLA